jgi:hypothetical protein
MVMLYVVGTGSAAKAGKVGEGSVTITGGRRAGSSFGVRGDISNGVGGVHLGSEVDDEGAASELSAEELLLATEVLLVIGISLTTDISVSMGILTFSGVLMTTGVSLSIKASWAMRLG